MMGKILFLFLLVISSTAFGQIQTIDADCIRIRDGECIDKDELSSLDGADSALQGQIDLKAEDADVVHLTGDESISDDKTFTGKIVASTTANGNINCPVMTETQRNAIASPVAGECVYNSTTLTLNVYNGTTWKSAGGGVNKWATSTSYQVDDVVIQSNKFYICLTAHTSGTFATDLAALKWQQVQPLNASEIVGQVALANGGTNKNITAANGSVLYTDTDSVELLAAGTSGQILQTNGAGAPSFVNKSISGKAQNQSAVTLEEVQVPNNQLTETASGKYLNESGNTNLLVNPSFEHSTASTGWTSTTVTPSVSTSTMVDGKQSLCFTASAQAFTLRQDSSLYAAAFANGFPGLASVSIKTNHTGAVTFCSANAGTVSTTNCQTITANDQWFPYQLPFVLGGTSNGISISAASGTGTTCVDFAKVEVGLTKADTFNSRPFVTYAGSGTWSTNTTYSTKYRQYGSLANIQAKVSLTGAPTGSFTLNLPSGLSIDTSKTPDTSLIQFIGTCLDNDTGTNTYACDIKYNNSTSITLSINAASGTWLTSSDGLTATTPYTHGNTDYIVLDFWVPITGWADTNTNYAAACGAACVDKFSARVADGSGTTVVTSEDADFINGVCTNPTTGNYVCTFNSGIFTVAPACWVTPRQGGGTSVEAVIDSVSASSVSIHGASSSGVAQDMDFQFGCNKQGVDFIATRTIVGSFKDVVTSVGSGNSSSAGADIQSVFFGGGADCTTDCTSGSCTICSRSGSKITSVAWQATGNYRPTGIDGTKYNCTGSVGTNNYVAILHDRSTSTSTYANVFTKNSSSALANAAYGSLICIGVP